jgi:spore germination protein KB
MGMDRPFTRRQAIAILMMFNFGSSVVMGVSTGVKQDSWIALALGTVFSLPIVLMYARIISLNPGKSLFEALESRLGRVLGKLACVLMSWYALHLGALVLRNFSEFIQVSALLETPQLPVLIIMTLTICALILKGAKALGKWAVATLPVVLFVVVITVIFSLGIMKFDNILPMFEHPFGDIAKEGFSIFSFPFAETVVFLGVADCVRQEDRPAGVYLIGILLSAAILLVIILRNLFILGPAVVSVEYFPSFAAARIISVGDFLSRIEGSISINFMLAGVTKIAVCLIAASRGLACLFGVKDWKILVLPSGLLAVALSSILYGNLMEMFAFVKFYPYYAIPFEIAVPVLLWAVSEIRAKRERREAQAVS